MDKIEEMRAQGKSIRAIAAETGLTYYAVRKHLTQACQPAPEGSDLAQPMVEERIKALEALVENLQEQLRPILKERAKSREEWDENRPVSGLRLGKRTTG